MGRRDTECIKSGTDSPSFKSLIFPNIVVNMVNRRNLHHSVIVINLDLNHFYSKSVLEVIAKTTFLTARVMAIQC